MGGKDYFGWGTIKLKKVFWGNNATSCFKLSPNQSMKMQKKNVYSEAQSVNLPSSKNADVICELQKAYNQL